MGKRTFLVFIFSGYLGLALIWGQPVRLHPDNPHYFLYEGKARVFITSGEHYGALLNLDFDYQKYLYQLKAEGMDYTRIFTGIYVENAESFGIEHNPLAPLKNKLMAPWARSDQPGYVNGGNTFDLNSWNSTYFERLLDLVGTAHRLGIIVEVSLFSSIYKEAYWRYSPLYPDNNINGTTRIDHENVHTLSNGNLLPFQEAMVQKVVTELNDFDNVIYEIQNEPWSDQKGRLYRLNRTVIPQNQQWTVKSNLASEASLKWQSHIAGIIRETEASLPKKHLIAQNYCNYGQPVPAVDNNVDIMNFHYAWPEAVHWNYGFNRPISFDESGFAPHEKQLYRRMAWRFMLAGGAVFNNLDYSFVPGHEDGSFEKNTSPGLGTKKLRKQYRYLHDFLSSLDLISMQPANYLVMHAPGFNYQVLWKEETADGAFYLEGNGKCRIKLKVPAGNYKVSWLSPKECKLMYAYSATSDGILSLDGPEVMHDVVLSIEKTP